MVQLNVVVMPTEDGRLSHAELVAFGQRRVAHGAREAAYVEDQMAGAHDQLGGADRGHAAGTAFRTEDAVAGESVWNGDGVNNGFCWCID